MEEYGIMEYLELTVTRYGRWTGNREFIWSGLRTKHNICIYLESISNTLSCQAQKNLTSFKHYEQCRSTDNTYFCPRNENIRTGHTVKN